LTERFTVQVHTYYYTHPIKNCMLFQSLCDQRSLWLWVWSRK